MASRRSPAFRAPPLRVDPERYPSLSKNPPLERALRIRQAMESGKPRDEAVRLADQAMGRRVQAPRRRATRQVRA